MNKEITCVCELMEWINNSKTGCECGRRGNRLYVKGIKNLAVHLDVQADDDIDDIIFCMIAKLRNCNADKAFMELWNRKFAQDNDLTPTQCLGTMIEDEGALHRLASKLNKFYIKQVRSHGTKNRKLAEKSTKCSSKTSIKQ